MNVAPRGIIWHIRGLALGLYIKVISKLYFGDIGDIFYMSRIFLGFHVKVILRVH